MLPPRALPPGRLDSIAVAEKTIEDDPDDHETRTRVAALYLQAGRTDDAVTHLQTALRLEPEHAPAHYNLGYALSVLGRRAEAIAAYQRAISRSGPTTRTRAALWGACCRPQVAGRRRRHSSV